jgi:hypothetical protein
MKTSTLVQVSRFAAIVAAASATHAYGFDFSAADAAFAERSKTAKATEARKLYNDALASISGDEKIYAVEQLARLDYYEGNKTPESDAEGRKKAFKRCMDSVEEIKSTATTKPMYNYWRGLCLASWARANGVLKSLEKAGEIIDLVEKGRAIDESYEGGGFVRLGSAVYFNLPPLFGGDVDKAWDYSQKAIASPAWSGSKNPDTDSGNYHFAAYLYAAQIAAKRDGKAAARAIAQDALDRIEAGDVSPDREPESMLNKKEIEDYLASL